MHGGTKIKTKYLADKIKHAYNNSYKGDIIWYENVLYCSYTCFACLTKVAQATNFAISRINGLFISSNTYIAVSIQIAHDNLFHVKCKLRWSLINSV